MPKSLLQILKQRPGSKTSYVNQPPRFYSPDRNETAIKAFLKKLPVQDHDWPYGNADVMRAKDVKVFDRAANRFGHPNVPFQDIPRNNPRLPHVKVTDDDSEQYWASNEETEITEDNALTMTVPLFIRFMEFARESAKDDLILHKIADRACEAQEETDVLCSDDYKDIVKEALEEGQSEPLNTQQITTKKSLRTVIKRK